MIKHGKTFVYTRHILYTYYHTVIIITKLPVHSTLYHSLQLFQYLTLQSLAARLRRVLRSLWMILCLHPIHAMSLRLGHSLTHMRVTNGSPVNQPKELSYFIGILWSLLDHTKSLKSFDKIEFFANIGPKDPKRIKIIKEGKWKEKNTLKIYDFLPLAGTPKTRRVAWPLGKRQTAAPTQIGVGDTFWGWEFLRLPNPS